MVETEQGFWLIRDRLNTIRPKLILAVAFALLLLPASAWAWGDQGHEIVAVIAADNLTPAAQSHVASVLGASASRRATASAMEAASIRPDTEFRAQDRATEQWHFIDVCLQDQRSDLPARCPHGGCVNFKIDDFANRLRTGNYDRWGAAGDLAFLIHFVGDVHQPLHAANNEDRGGNCIRVESRSRARNLHDAWDTAIVRHLEYDLDSGRPETTAHKLERKYSAEQASDSWIPADDIAWESHQLARSDIYDALRIPLEPCQPKLNLCVNPVGHPVELDSAYMKSSSEVAGHQLAKAGFRLASLLNQIWTMPVAPSDAAQATNSVVAPASSMKSPVLQVIGNRRSKIYAWPGCGSYDTMASENRVLFSSREAAEQQGYRAAHNCP
ncbi:MAG TPA: S1/P1 nuclease [Candidatus Binatus sp.]|nr:S1/P1 nuclease [Candidatus Binatus sp.]